MLNALTRFCHKKYRELEVEEITREHWHVIENGDRFGRVAEHEVWMCDDPPPFDHLEHLTIYDSRQAELLIEIRKQSKETVRPGFKAIPMGFNFGKRS